MNGTLAESLAYWAVLFMGWVWLGEQGQRLGWSMAGGVHAVALWWAVRLLAISTRLAPMLSGGTTVLLGAATAAGMLVIERGEAGPHAHTLLLAVAMTWGVWAGTLEAGRRTGPASQASNASRTGPPIVAAALVWVALYAPDGWLSREWRVAGLLLILMTLVLLGGVARSVRTHFTPAHTPFPLQSISAGNALSATAMGLMMGSLWLGTAWCTTQGWSQHTAVGLHLMGMAVLPALVRPALIRWRLSDHAVHSLALVLLVLAAVFLQTSNNALRGPAGMALIAAAWALCALPRRTPATAAPRLPWHWLSLVGPALLLAVGQTSITQGPEALAWAYGTLGVLSLAALLLRARHKDQPSASHSPASWRNAT